MVEKSVFYQNMQVCSDIAWSIAFLRTPPLQLLLLRDSRCTEVKLRLEAETCSAIHWELLGTTGNHWEPLGTTGNH